MTCAAADARVFPGSAQAEAAAPVLLRGGAHVAASWRDVVLQPTKTRANGRAVWRGELTGGKEVWLRFSASGKWFITPGPLGVSWTKRCAHITCAAGDEGLPTGARVWQLHKSLLGVADEASDGWARGELTLVTGAAAAAAQVSRGENQGVGWGGVG